MIQIFQFFYPLSFFVFLKPKNTSNKIFKNLWKIFAEKVFLWITKKKRQAAPSRRSNPASRYSALTFSLMLVWQRWWWVWGNLGFDRLAHLKCLQVGYSIFGAFIFSHLEVWIERLYWEVYIYSIFTRGKMKFWRE